MCCDSTVCFPCAGRLQRSAASRQPDRGGSGPYTIGGTVTGMTGTGLVLQDDGGDNLTITKAGTFAFAKSITSGGAYLVTVVTQPTGPAQSCAVTGGSGTATANVTTVAIACTNAAVNATIGVTVSGLTGSGLVLQDNGGDSLTVPTSGSYTFKTPVTGAYSVTVLTQPISPNQLCTVASGSGTATANVAGIAITCVTASRSAATSPASSAPASFCRTIRATTTPSLQTAPSHSKPNFPRAPPTL